MVETLKSGFTPPPDKEFEDYTNPSNRKHADSNEGIQRSRPTKGGGLSWIFGKKVGLRFDDCCECEVFVINQGFGES